MFPLSTGESGAPPRGGGGGGTACLVWRVFENAHVCDLDMGQALALVQEEEAVDAAHHLAGPAVERHTWPCHSQHSCPGLQESSSDPSEETLGSACKTASEV